MAKRLIHVNSNSSGYLPETIAYIAAENAAGRFFTVPESDGIDRWFRDLFGYFNGSYSTFNVFSRITVCNPYLAATFAADRVNAVSPGIFDYVDTGSPTYSSSPFRVSYNGSSQYSDTTFTPNGSNTFGTSDFTGFGIHRADTTSGTGVGGQVGELGGGNSYMNLATAFKTINLSAQSAFNQPDAHAINGLWMTYWNNSGTLKTMYNGGVIKTVSIAFNNSPNRSFYQGAVHSSSPVYGQACSFDFHIEVKGAWTDAEAQLIYDATKALKSVFGIIWI